MAIGNRYFPHVDALLYWLQNIWLNARYNVKVCLEKNKYIRNILNIEWKNLFKFTSVGASGAIINLVFLWILADFGHLFYLLSALIAIEISILWNFTLNTKLTFNYKFGDKYILLDSVIRYHLASLVGLFINLSVLFSLTEFININYIISEAVAILLAFGFNYTLSMHYVWRKNA